MLQFIVLLSIMALWALTSLLSREAQPLPPRLARGQGPGGPRPGFGPGRADALITPRAGGAADRLPAPTLERGVSPRWNDAPSALRPAPGRGLGPDDGIMILDGDARLGRPAADGRLLAPNPANRRTTTARRGTRGRSPSASGAAKPVEPGRPRALTTMVTQSMAQKKNRPLEITPLSAPLSPINAPLTQISTGAKIEHPGSPDSPPAFTAETLKTMLANPTKLREVALLTELLQPPLALRRSRRPR